jgi:sirohydrochlorin ferrochelatase
MDQIAADVAQKLQHLQSVAYAENPIPERAFNFWGGDLDSDRVGAAVATSSAALSVVGSACLECHPLSLHEQIQVFGHQAIAQGCSRLQILPMFLLSGKHLMEDIPAEIELAQTTLPETFSLALLPHIGTHANLSRLLTTYLAGRPVEVWVLLAHGSRRATANAPVEQLAQRLGAITAYWSISPDLASQLAELQAQGYRRIAILPYFLFAGGITDAIGQTVVQLSQQFPDLELMLAEPLQAIVELSDLVVDLIQSYPLN